MKLYSTAELTEFKVATHAVRYILPVLRFKEWLAQRAMNAGNLAN